MNVIRYWIAVLLVGGTVLFLGFGCATKSENSKTTAPSTVSAPMPSQPQPATNSTPPVAATPAVYVPDMTHANGPLPDGIIAWDDLTKATDATNGQAQAHFTFNFTNVTSGNIAIVTVHPSCGCTTAQLPPLPWI